MNFVWKKIFLGGLGAGLVILAISFVFTIATQSIFGYDMASLAGMRPWEDPVMLLFFAHPWVLGFAMSVAFSKFKGSFSNTGLCRGKAFGLYVWLLAGLPSAFLVWTSMDYPAGFFVNSFVGSLVYMVAAGLVLEKAAA
jgi:uncharacterized membrane protein